MLKDNHLTVLSVTEAVRRAKEWYPARTIQVECDTVDTLAEALDAGADAVLLDNMSPEEVGRCVALADEHAAARRRQRPLVEVSGGVTLETIGRYADLGADQVSSGSLTNSAPVLDIGLDIDGD
jgi:nicotinate-nucleotide pyrophosphorylase (carboxylating)